MRVLGIWFFGLLILSLVVLRTGGVKGFWRRFVRCSLGGTIGGVLSAAFLLTGIHEMIVSGLGANWDFISRVTPLSLTMRRGMEELVRSSVMMGTIYLGMAVGAFLFWPHKKKEKDEEGEEVASDELKSAE